jgi:hypothetical protein
MSWSVNGTAALTAVVAGAVGTPATAQDSEAVTDISFEIAGQYDSNVARSNAARAAVRGLDRADQRFTPTLRIDVARSFGRVRAAVDGSIGYDFYRRNNQLERERIDLGGTLAVPAGPCLIGTSVGAARSQTDLGNIAFSTALSDVNVRNTETRLTTGAELSCGRETGIRPTASVEFITARNSNPARERAESDALSYRAGLSYVSSTIGDVFLFAGRRDVSRGSQFVATGQADYRVTDYGVRYRRDIGSRLTLSATVARSSINSDTVGLPTRSGLSWSIDAVTQVGSRVQLSVNTGREFTNSLSSDAAYLRSQPSSVRIIYAATDRLQLNGGFSNSVNRYTYAQPPLGQAITRDTRRIVDAGVSYAVGRRWHISVSGGHENRNANGTVFDYSSSFGRLALSLSL